MKAYIEDRVIKKTERLFGLFCYLLLQILSFGDIVYMLRILILYQFKFAFGKNASFSHHT